MAVLLFLLFIVLPLLELFVIVEVAGTLGILPTIVLLVSISLVGSWLVRREGLGVVRRARAMLDAGELPTGEVVDGVLLVFAGALLLTPGFVTDAVGLFLLVPPTRALTRRLLTGRFRRRLGFVGGVAGAASSAGARAWTATGFGTRSKERQYVGEAIIVDDRPNEPDRGLKPGRRPGPGSGPPSDPTRGSTRGESG
jgi:UPF0716 protein FxsA